MNFSTESSTLALFMNGKWAHIINPWKIKVDTAKEVIIVSKRNKFLIGVDEKILTFKYIRSIHKDEHLFGADLHVSVMEGTVSVYFLSKRDARAIQKMLVEYNQKNAGNAMIFS